MLFISKKSKETLISTGSMSFVNKIPNMADPSTQYSPRLMTPEQFPHMQQMQQRTNSICNLLRGILGAPVFSRVCHPPPRAPTRTTAIVTFRL